MTMTTKRPTVPAAEEILGGYFPVLDHGFVSLVDYMGTDSDVERAARVSYGYGTRQTSKTRGLVRYLRRHRHTTPSEMVELKFHVCMPIFVARQFIRHRTASVNEYSGRYSLMPLLFYTPEQDNFALQSKGNNQGREAEAAQATVYHEAVRRWERLREDAADGYGWMVGEDVARELARIDLPLSIYTQWYWKIDMHNLLHFLTLRVDSHAQWEIQQYGRVIAGMLARVAPLSYEAWLDYDVMGRRMSGAEMDVLRHLVRPGEDGRLVTNASWLDLRAQADEFQMSGREVDEIMAKLGPDERPDFALDLGNMVEAEEMAARVAEAVPSPGR